MYTCSNYTIFRQIEFRDKVIYICKRHYTFVTQYQITRHKKESLCIPRRIVNHHRIQFNFYHRTFK